VQNLEIFLKTGFRIFDLMMEQNRPKMAITYGNVDIFGTIIIVQDPISKNSLVFFTKRQGIFNINENQRRYHDNISKSSMKMRISTLNEGDYQ